MTHLLQYSLFQDILFPSDEDDNEGLNAQDLTLQKVLRYQPGADLEIKNTPIVIFDFETTGLDSREDRIVEIGALRIENFQVTQEFSTLVKPDVALTDTSIKLTGITPEMLKGQPGIDQSLPEFIDFSQGAILVAHNAEFDMGFFRQAAKRLGYQLHWPCFCTLKLARILLPDLESKNLDSLAEHYGLSFEARHRSIGDVKVTAGVLQNMLENEGQQYQCWGDFETVQVKES